MLYALIEGQEAGLIEKARDMGATWICCAVSVHLWIYSEGSIGWGSRKREMVDELGNMSSIFEKIRQIIKRLPRLFWPKGFNPKVHLSQRRVVNPASGASIIGEIGDDIGRGGRTMLYFKDESAHYEHPDSIEAALGDNTNVQIDISSVHGIGNVFHRRREAGLDWNGEVEEGRTHVFVMDWRDHPAKSQRWYDKRKAKAAEEGLTHVFAQEVDRDYSASVVGVLIKMEWVEAAIDAHIKLGFKAEGRRFAGLDVCDGGIDLNALADRTGPVLTAVEDWPGDDVGAATRKAVRILTHGAPVSVQYDSIGLGSGVKSEANRLEENRKEKLEGADWMPEGIDFVGWAASAKVLDPDEHLVLRDDGTADENSPLNKDFFANLKAQGWWQLMLRFQRTYRAIEEGLDFDPDTMISLSSDIPQLQKLKKELCQVTTKTSTGSLKIVIDKTPEGTKSPNLADAVMMCYWPLNEFSYDLEGML
jgi:hypothetical protein